MIRRIASLLLLACPIVLTAQENCSTVYGFGLASAHLALSFPGDGVCVTGSDTNAKAWYGSTSGSAQCPTTFNAATGFWNYSLTYFSDYYSAATGAGCWFSGIVEFGPGVFGAGVTNCASDNDVCEEAYVTTLGEFVGVGAIGVYHGGETYYFGESYCYPYSTEQRVCTNGATSPIIIDVDGSGYHLTSAAGGVQFDFYGTGQPIQIAWTAWGSTNAFLVLPSAGGVPTGAQLFGNVTPQPASPTPNGFLALAVYDSNGDGVINAADPIYAQLRLWQDVNHDGIAQPAELHTLPSLSVAAIQLNYQSEKRVDQYGNVFRYRAGINDDGSKWVYDVILEQ